VVVVKKLDNIIKKNLKLILRSKSSALIVILGPLLLILLVGAAFNTANVHGIRIGVFSEEYSGLSESIIEELGDRQFDVIKIEDRDGCISSVKEGEAHVCVIFPSKLNVKSESTITFYVDPSRMNLVYIIMEGISSKVETKSEELSLQLTSNILGVMEDASNEVSDKALLVAELSANAEDFEARINKMLADFAALDLSIDEDKLNFDLIESEIGNLNSESNNSFIKLGKRIGLLKVELDKIKNQVGDTNAVRFTAITQLELMKKILTTEINYLKTIKNTMENINTQVNTVAIKSAGKIVSPITTKIEPVTTKQTNLSFLFPTLLVMVIMFISTLLSSTLVIKEKVSTAYFRNFLTPTSDFLFILANYLSNIIIVVLQLVIILAVAVFFFGRELFSVIGPVALVLLLISSVFILLGMLIGNVFKSEETGVLAAISISSLLLFFSNTILPTESLPFIFKKIVGFNPFIVSESLLRKLLLFDINAGLLLNEVYVLLGAIGILLMLVIISSLNVRKAK
jgi:ABC-type multidrug transport system permease subunit